MLELPTAHYFFSDKVGAAHWAANYCIQGKFRPRFIFDLFALWRESEFKTGLIEVCTKDYIRKQESGRIQDWANQFQIS